MFMHDKHLNRCLNEIDEVSSLKEKMKMNEWPCNLHLNT